MPRPTKCRKVCHFPPVHEFSPVDRSDEKEPVILTIDEYETIRLIDKEGFSQEQCASFMQIARTTVQRIYENARRKIADCLVEARPLRIEGGDFWLCNGQNDNCKYEGCFKQHYHQKHEKPKGETIMRVAITYDNGLIFQHFGRTEQFKVYDIMEGEVFADEIVDTNGNGHGALAGILNAMNVDLLICGGIGGGAQAALAAAGIKVYGGISGCADDAIEAFLAGELEFNPYVQCNHHEHHDEGHSCGDHGCGGEHHCGDNGCGS